MLASIDFEDTYDGLGDQLDEADDDLNDDTFGGGGAGENNVARDFDFHGSTSKVTDAINEEAARFQRQTKSHSQQPFAYPPSALASKPYRSGYETYKTPGYVPDLQVDPSLWASDSTSRAQEPAHEPLGQQQKTSTAPPKKMMSLEEVEAAMRAQPKKPSPLPVTQEQQGEPQSDPFAFPARQPPPFTGGNPPQSSLPSQMQTLQHQSTRAQGHLPQPPVEVKQDHVSHSYHHDQRSSYSAQTEMQAIKGMHQANSIGEVPSGMPVGQSSRDRNGSRQPRQILQNPKRTSTQPSLPSYEIAMNVNQPSNPQPLPLGGSQVRLPIVTHPAQITKMPEEQKQALLAEETKRTKRNHKIFLMSKGNGLMTPQDKNFITRIQLQQLMTTTGIVHDKDSDATLSEDFYYQVYNQIENRPRQHPNQPLSNFAHTYLFQTGNRRGGIHRRHNRGDNHVHRMQQQVQRAVEAAKAKPKNKQLVIEGSLGKISFSNAKTPKPLLNLKKNDKMPQATLNATDRKAILKNIEAVYASLMAIEDHDRRIPQDHRKGDDPDTAEPFKQWTEEFTELSQRLWSNLKVMEPITPDSTTMHPFIAFLSYPKGKKAIPRVFSHIDQEQRLTVLTIIMVQLDSLDVIRSLQSQVAAKQSPVTTREQIDLFLQTVMPSLFSYVTEASLSIIIGLVGLVLERVNVSTVVHSRVGLEILTMLLSQAEIIRKSEQINSEEWEQWLVVYNRLFDTVEPLLTTIFPGSVSVSQDVYVWQFLATVGTGANPEQQQRLVLAVK